MKNLPFRDAWDDPNVKTGCDWFISGDRLDALIDNGEVVTLQEHSEAEAQDVEYP